MDDETIVAVYDTPAHAQLAAADLQQAGIPADAITQHASGSAITDATAGTAAGSAGSAHESGFWSRLFGGEPDYDTGVYSRSVQGGSTVVSVRATENHVSTIMGVLESHHPIDIDERAASYGLTGAASTTSASTATTAGLATAPTASTSSIAATGEGDKMQLSEERLAVGKRLVNRGGTRIRRYVVETPVEQQVSLREERVSLERRPVTDSRPASSADFSEKVIEMTENAEEAVVGKTVHVTEEVSLRKQSADRVETVRDTVRRQEVEVEDVPAATMPGAPASATGAPITPKQSS